MLEIYEVFYPLPYYFIRKKGQKKYGRGTSPSPESYSPCWARRRPSQSAMSRRAGEEFGF